MSRPSKKSKAVIDEICERLAEGEPLRQICRSEHMPKWRTVYDWIEADQRLSARIARARELGADAIADDILRIVDDARNDWMGQFNAEGERVGSKFNAENVQRSRLRAETRLKLLAKWFPAKYGDKVVAEVTGQNGHLLIDDSDVREAAQILLGGRIPSALPK